MKLSVIKCKKKNNNNNKKNVVVLAEGGLKDNVRLARYGLCLCYYLWLYSSLAFIHARVSA